MLSKIYGVGVLLIWLLAVTSVVAEAEPSPKLNLKILSEEKRPLNRDVYGTNNQLLAAPFWYDEASFADVYRQAGQPFFRFPGGTYSNYYEAKSGLLNEKAPTHHDWPKLNKAILAQRGGKGKTPKAFFEFADKTQARYSVVLNIGTMTLEENREWLRSLVDQGIKIPAFEIGNELYYGIYEWAAKTPASYVEEAKEYTSMIRQLFPEAKVGVIIPSLIYTKEVFVKGKVKSLPKRYETWYSLLEKEDFFDGVIIHLYSNIGMNHKTKKENFLPFVEAYDVMVKHVEAKLDLVFEHLEKKYPGKEIWVTEFGTGGFGGPVRQYQLRHSHLGLLHSDLMMLRYLSRPSVTVTHWHSFRQCFSWDSEKKRAVGGTRHFQHLTMFAEPVNNSKSFAPVRSSEKSVEVGAFLHEDKGYLIVINKRAQGYRLGKVSGWNHLEFVSGVQLTPDSKLPVAEAVERLEAMERKELGKAELEEIEIPGYSISTLRFK